MQDSPFTKVWFLVPVKTAHHILIMQTKYIFINASLLNAYAIISHMVNEGRSEVEAERLNGLAWAKSSVPAIHGLGKDQKNKILINKNRHTGPQFKFVCLNRFMTSMMP